MAAEDVFADAVLDGTPIASAVARVTREGRPGWFAGLDQLSSAVAARRAIVESALDVTTTFASVAEPLNEAVRLEYRTLFADPDDLARLEEAELLGLPSSPAAIYQALRSRTWRSADAEDSFRPAREVASAVHHGVVEQAAEQLASLSTDQVAAMTTALAHLCTLAVDRPNPNRPLDPEDSSALAPLTALACWTGAAPPLITLMDELRWRRSAQDRLVPMLGPASQRRLTIAWHNLTGHNPELATTVQRWHRVSGPVPSSGPTPHHLAGRGQRAGSALGVYLFTALIDPIAETADLDQLDRSIAQDYPGAGLDDIAADAVERAVGRQSRQQLEELRRAVHAVTFARSSGEGATVDSLAIRRRVPVMALRRGMTPGLRRELGGPPTSSSRPGAQHLDDSMAVMVLVDRTGPATRWPGIRAAALAVTELVHRRNPGQDCVVVVTGPGDEVRTVRPSQLLDLPAAPADRSDHDPGQVISVLRRAGMRTEQAVLLVLGDATLGAALTRIGARWDWTVRSVPPSDLPEPQEQTTAIIRQTLTALVR